MQRTSEFILNFILNSCWQMAAIAAVAAIGSALLKNAPARYRHTLWLFTLAACLVVPLLTATRFVPARVLSLQTVAPEIPKQVLPASHSSATDLPVNHLVTRRRIPVNTTPQSAVVLTLVYALFISGAIIRLARFWKRKERLRRSATHAGLPPAIELVAQRCRRIFGVRSVVVARTNQTRVPYTLGARRPLVLLPEAFCASADETKLLSVIGHELAHVARRDFLSNLICELVSLPISFHPLTFLIKQQIDRTREIACDELVTKHVLEPRVYARSLLWAADVSRQYSPQAFMLSIFDGKILEERIKRLTRNTRHVGAGPARVMMFAALFILCVSAMSLSIFSLELQTQVRAVVQPLQIAPTQDPVVPPVAASPARSESQVNTPALSEDRTLSACKAGRNSDVAAIPKLIALLGDDSKTQFEVCYDASRWSPALQTFKHPSPGEQAAIALASFGRPAYVALSNELNSPNATVRRNAAWAIGELTNMVPGERAGAVPQLISLLSDDDEWVRMAAARALGEVHDKRAVDGLVARLSDDNWQVRQLVVWALSETKDDRAVTPLCSVLLSDVRVEVRRDAAEALGEIGSAEAIPSLKQALNDAAAGVSAKAAWAISEIEG
jgi:beta-lactamase regulating signal transducer with metallopeptidase domain